MTGAVSMEVFSLVLGGYIPLFGLLVWLIKRFVDVVSKNAEVMGSVASAVDKMATELRELKK